MNIFKIESFPFWIEVCLFLHFEVQRFVKPPTVQRVAALSAGKSRDSVVSTTTTNFALVCCSSVGSAANVVVVVAFFF